MSGHYLHREPHCTNCDSNPTNRKPELVTDFASGDVVCSKCGMVIEGVIDDRMVVFVSQYDTESNSALHHGESRNENPITGGDSLDVSISLSGVGFDNLSLAKDIARSSNQSKKLKQAPNIYQESFKDLHRYCQDNSLPYNVITKAEGILTSIEKNYLSRNKINCVAVSIYLSCRSFQIARTIEEICKICNIDKKNDFSRVLNKVRKDFLQKPSTSSTSSTSENTNVLTPIHSNQNLRSITSPQNNTISSVSSLKEIVGRHCQNLNIGHTKQMEIEKLVEKIQDGGFMSGKNPSTVLAVSILKCLGKQNVNMASLTATLGITQQTILKSYPMIQDL